MSKPVTLLGEIPGLLIPGVLVRLGSGGSYRVRAVRADDEGILVDLYSTEDTGDDTPAEIVRLDLSDRVSRIAAAWWVIERGPVTDEEHVILFTVKNNGHLNRKGQEQLRDMVLRRYNRSQT